METQGDRGPGTEPELPSDIRTKGDQYLYRRIEEVSSGMNEIVKALNALPAEVDAKLKTFGQAIESLSKLSENVEKIRGESTEFRGFQDRIERHEQFIKIIIKKYAFRRIIAVATGVLAVIGAAYYLGTFLTTISANVSEMKNSAGEVKGSIDKLQAITYELNGTTKAQGERLRSIDEQLKAVQVSMRETPAKTAAETSEKAAERIAGVLEAVEKRVGKGNADLVGKIDAIERRVEEASDVLVLWLALNPADKPISGSDTTLTYYAPVPPQERQKVIQAGQSRSKTLQAGVVSFYEGGEPLKPPGVIAATAQPMKDEGRIPIHLFFQDKGALEGFKKVMDRLREDRKLMRLKVTFALG